jgi:hypothetical protein
MEFWLVVLSVGFAFRMGWYVVVGSHVHEENVSPGRLNGSGELAPTIDSGRALVSLRVDDEMRWDV